MDEAKWQQFLALMCENCRTEMWRTLSDTASVWSCDTCGTDDKIAELDWIDTTMELAAGEWYGLHGNGKHYHPCLCEGESCPTCTDCQCSDCGRVLCQQCIYKAVDEEDRDDVWGFALLCMECANDVVSVSKTEYNDVTDADRSILVTKVTSLPGTESAPDTLWKDHKERLVSIVLPAISKRSSKRNVATYRKHGPLYDEYAP